MSEHNPSANRPAGTIDVFHAFPPDIEGTQAEFHVHAPTSEGPHAVLVPVILRYEGGQPLVVIYDWAGSEIWKLDLEQFQAALSRGAELIEG